MDKIVIYDNVKKVTNIILGTLKIKLTRLLYALDMKGRIKRRVKNISKAFACTTRRMEQILSKIAEDR
jgi:hypothetical protein